MIPFNKYYNHFNYISGILIVCSLVLLVFKGLNFVIDFTDKAVEENETTLLILDDVTQQLKKSNALQSSMNLKKLAFM